MILALLWSCSAGFDTGWGNACVFYSPGCGSGSGYAEVDPNACYQACGKPGEECSSGTCTEAWIDPCAGGECASCGATAMLCM